MTACAFCSAEAKITGEHLWSNWYGEAVIADGPPNPRFTFVRLERRGESQEVIGEWAAPAIDLTANVVCAACNNGWMSRVEQQHAKPTLKDIAMSPLAETCLLPRGLVSIAAFAFLKAVVGDHMVRGREPFFTRPIRRQFRDDLTIPRGVQVWLGTFIGRRKRFGHFTNQYIRINNGRFKGYEIYVFTYILGFVAIQLTASRWMSLIKPPPNYIPKLVQVGEWPEGTHEIWPGEGIPFAVWPPPKIIGDQTLNTFIDRWRNLTERSIRFS